MYQKPSAEKMRAVANGFGSMSAKTMIDIRQRAAKIMMMDLVNFLFNEKKMSKKDIHKDVMSSIDKFIEAGYATVKMKDTLSSYIEKRCVAKDPILRLHAAITMETLEATGGEGDPDVESLPQEVQDAAECGANCFGSRPSIESLGSNDCQLKLFSAVGGTIADQLIRVLGTSINTDYVAAR